jgi:hypothetical protein
MQQVDRIDVPDRVEPIESGDKRRFEAPVASSFPPSQTPPHLAEEASYTKYQLTLRDWSA